MLGYVMRERKREKGERELGNLWKGTWNLVEEREREEKRREEKERCRVFGEADV